MSRQIWPKAEDETRKERCEILRALEDGERTAREVLEAIQARGCMANITRVATILASFYDVGWIEREARKMDTGRVYAYRFGRRPVTLRSDLYERLKEVAAERADKTSLSSELDMAIEEEWLPQWENFYKLGEYQIGDIEEDAID